MAKGWLDKYPDGGEIDYSRWETDEAKKAKPKLIDGEVGYEMRYALPEIEVKGKMPTPEFAKDWKYWDQISEADRKYLRENEGKDDPITRSIRAKAVSGYGIGDNPTFGQSTYDFAMKPFQYMGEMAAETTGIPAAYRISQDPMGTLEGVYNTAADAAYLNSLQGMINLYQGTLGDGEFNSTNPFTGKQYGSGLEQTGDVLSVVPGIGIAGRGIKQGAKSLLKNVPKVANKTKTLKNLLNSDVSTVILNARKENVIRDKIQDIKFTKNIEPRIEKQLQLKIDRSKDPRGFELLKNQEKEYLESIGVSPKYSEDLAKYSAKSRIAELEDIQDTKAYGWIPKDNAYYQTPRTRYDIVDDTFKKDFFSDYTPISPTTRIDDIKPNNIIDLNKNTYSGAGKSTGGSMAFGTNYGSNPIIQHELAHSSQLGRKLPIDYELRSIYDKADVNNYIYTELPSDKIPDVSAAWDYFNYNRSTSLEPLAFAHELKQSMLQRGIIKDWFEEITPMHLTKAKKSFNDKPVGIYDPFDDSMLTGHRMLDFTSPKYFGKLSKTLNKVAPAAVGAAGGAAVLNEKADGGAIPNTTKTTYNNWLDKL